VLFLVGKSFALSSHDDKGRRLWFAGSREFEGDSARVGRPWFGFKQPAPHAFPVPIIDCEPIVAEHQAADTALDGSRDGEEVGFLNERQVVRIDHAEVSTALPIMHGTWRGKAPSRTVAVYAVVISPVTSP
jgi:hypothetical protein